VTILNYHLSASFSILSNSSFTVTSPSDAINTLLRRLREMHLCCREMKYMMGILNFLIRWQLAAGLDWACCLNAVHCEKQQLLNRRVPVPTFRFNLRRSQWPAARSEPWTLFVRSNAGIVGSNTIQRMDVCVRLFCVYVVLCVGSGLATGWSLVQGVLPTVYRLRKQKSRQDLTKSCRAIYRLI
jgi:hypothetical protein